MMNARRLLTIDNLSKKFDGVTALSSVSLQLAAGTITAVIGPNGAGKTTLLDAITGYTMPESGRVFVGETDVTGKRPEFIANMGVSRTFQAVRLARKLSVMDNLLLAAGGRSNEKLKQFGFVAPPLDDGKAKEVLKEVQLDAKPEDIVGTLSFGAQKLLSLALASVTQFKILLLDEPFAGISGSVVEVMTKLVQRWKNEGKGLLIVEHNIGAVVGISDLVVVLSEGRVFRTVRPAELKRADDILGEFIR